MDMSPIWMGIDVGCPLNMSDCQHFALAVEK